MTRRLGHRHIAALAGALGMAGTLLAAPASRADDKIVLRFADDIPKTHPISVYGSKFWMDTVERLTNGKVQFQWYPASQLGKGKDLLALAQSGAIDIVSVGPSYTPDKLPLSAVAELPGMFKSSCSGSQAAWQVLKPGGALDKDEYAPLRLHVVFGFTNPPYEVETVKKVVAMPEDMRGLRLKTLGGASDEAALKLGAVPVQMTVADLFLGLQRGTVDGRFGAFTSVFANSTQDVLKHSTVGADIGGFVLTTIMGDRKWKSLPPDVQQAMLKAGDATWENFCKEADKENVGQAKKLEAEHHWTLHQLSAAESEAWSKALAPVADAWASTLDKRGKAGTEVLKAFRAAVH
jgi:TRAP-type C4-dicarboxylate transport system substrate-binding protein